MNKYFNKKFAGYFLYSINIVFLCIHIIFFALFTILEVYVMSGMNIISILFYMLGFDFMEKNKTSVYMTLVAIEVLVHTVLAVLCVGLDCNFQLCLLAMISLFCVSEYIGKMIYKDEMHGGRIGVLYSISIVFLYIYGAVQKPLYNINSSVEKVTSVIIIFIVLIVLMMTLQLFSELTVYQEDKLSKQALFDALTGLPNRFNMLAKLEKMFSQEEQEKYYMAMIDIDDFKKINDSYGHNVGDDALKMLAKVIFENCSGMEFCRWGGEEFIIVSECKENEIDAVFLDELRKAVNECSVRTHRGSIRMTVTIGAAKYKTEQSIEEWIDSVDKKLYAGKCSGKNKVVYE